MLNALFILLLTFNSLNFQLESCDLIIFHDGSEISSIVEEIRLNEIAYRKCDNPTGPLYVVSKDKVFMIKYKNGSKELINSSNSSSAGSSTSSSNTSNYSKKYLVDLTEEEKNEIIASNRCYKVVPLPMNGRSFNALISNFKTVSVSFKNCNAPGGRLMNNIYIDYIESEKGDRIYFNKD